ncbi:class I SAM-dependent methyltransferase [Gemmatimonadota bacterium]
MKRFNLLEVDDAHAGHVDLELYFYTEVLKLKSLHFGYWTQGQDPTLGNFSAAQATYARTLIEMIPDGVETVLDVGCGAGDNSREMAAAGFAVTAISPDAEHGKFIQDTPGVDFVRTKIEDLDTHRKFDLVLMSECQNYFDRDLALGKCLEILEPGGYLLISGMFRRSNTEDLDYMYVGSEYIAAAKSAGFELLEQVDITAETVPTVEMFRNAYHDHLVPAVGLVSHYVNNISRWERILVRTFFGRQIRRLAGVREFIEQRVDSERFVTFASYERLLFRKKGPIHGG